MFWNANFVKVSNVKIDVFVLTFPLILTYRWDVVTFPLSLPSPTMCTAALKLCFVYMMVKYS